MHIASIDEGLDPELRALLKEFNLATRKHREAKRKAREASAKLKQMNQEITQRFLEKDVKIVSLGKDGTIKLLSSVKLETYDNL